MAARTCGSACCSTCGATSQRLQTLLDVAAPTATLEREHAASLHMTAEEEATRGVVTAVDVGAPRAAAGRQPHPPPHDAAAVQQQQGRGVVSLADTAARGASHSSPGNLGF
jgi:hypothetical protein